MNKKILTIIILAIALCMTIAFARPVMAADCTGENCTTSCKEEGCDGQCGADCCPIKMGEKCYPTMQAAIDVAEKTENTPATIELLGDTAGDGFVIKKGNITIDFGTFEYNITGDRVGSEGTVTNGCQLLKGATVTFKNGTLKSAITNTLIQNYSNLTIENMKLEANMQKKGVIPYALSNNCGKVNITGNTSIESTNVAFDVYNWNSEYPDGTQVTVNTTGTITGKIEVTSEKGKESSSKSTLDIENVKHNGELFVNDELSDKVTVNDGSFESDVTKYVRNNDVVISVKKGDKVNYYVGTSAEEELENIEEGSTITVTKGNLELENLPDNVTVKVEEGATATVDGYEVTESGVDTSVLNKLKELEELTKNLKEELKNQGLTQEEIAERLKAAEQLIKDQNGTIAELQEQIANLQKQYDELKGKDEQDETPGTGSVDVALITTVVAMISVAGIVAVKKYSK